MDHPLSERAYATMVFKASSLYCIHGNQRVFPGRQPAWVGRFGSFNYY